MKTSYLSGKTSNKRNGYILILGLLLMVVIGMAIYFMLIHGPVYEIGSGESGINPPWRQWHKLQVRLYRKEELGSPTEEQPQISKPLEISAMPQQDGQDRGHLKMIIRNDGLIQGAWGGQFFISKDVDFQVMACRFKGLVDPTEVYSDEEGEDPTKLFLIAKGPFVILETNSESAKVRKIVGNAYVRGWMDVNYVVDGELIITADERNFYRYTWRGRAGEPKPLLFKLDK